MSLVGKSDSTGSVRYLIDPLTKTILAAYDPGSRARLALYNQNPQKIDEVFSYKTAQATKYYPHTDMLGSVYAISDSTGTSQASWTYDVYGTRTQTSGSLTYAFGFTGREHDGDTGLIYSRARYYDPSVGQWLSKDRKWKINGANRYLYVGDQPTLMIDPSGNQSENTTNPFVQYIIAMILTIPAPGNDPIDLLDENIQVTLQEGGDFAFMAAQFTAGGAWDYVEQGGYDDFGNLNFGAVGAAGGYLLIVLQSYGGIAQQISNLAMNNVNSGGVPFIDYPYGDEAIDTDLIALGFEYFWFVYQPKLAPICPLTK